MGAHFGPAAVVPFFGGPADSFAGAHVDLEAIWALTQFRLSKAKVSGPVVKMGSALPRRTR